MKKVLGIKPSKVSLDTKMPFGPFLALWIYIVLFFFYCFSVKKYYEAIDLKVDSHIAHYKMIYTISQRVKDQINSMGFEW